MKRNLYILITIVITLCIQCGCTPYAGTETATPVKSQQAISAIIAQSDLLFKQRADLSKLHEAVDLLAGFRSPDQRNFDVEWKFAKCSYFLGVATKDEKDSEKIFTKGRDAGKIASSLDPTKPDGYFWYAANLGEISRLNPVTVGIKSVDDIKSSMYKVIELQPGYQNSSAYDALAQIEMETRVYGGTTDKAIELLETALQTEKHNGDLRINLAEAYLAAKKKPEARHQLDLLLQMTPDPDYMAEHAENVAQAKKMIQTKF